MRLHRILIRFWLLVAGAPAIAMAQGLTPAPVPEALAEPQKSELSGRRSALQSQREQLAIKANTHNGRCRNLPESSPLVPECLSAQGELNAEIAAYRSALVSFKRDVDDATQTRRDVLARQIERDAEAIRRLGFARRSEDFAEWERLAAKAKAEFEAEVIDVITDVAVDAVRGRLLDSFKNFDASKASRMIEWIRVRGIKPEPTALIAAIERVGRAPDKSRIADDAEFIVKQIEDFRKARAAAPDPVESAKVVAGLLEGTVTDPRIKTLIIEIKLTTAAVYNNASRRVARAEIERLTALTESQLKDLERLRALMERHVRQLNELNKAQGGKGA